MTKEPVDMEQIREQYEDAALTLLVNHIMQKEGRDLLEKSGELLQDPDFAYPADLDKRAAGTIERHFSALRRRRRIASAGKVFTHVAVSYFFDHLFFRLCLQGRDSRHTDRRI